MAMEIQKLMDERKEEGLEQGRVEGLGQGAAAIALSLLQQKFGVVPQDARAQIEGASSSEIAELATAIRDAESLDDLLENGGLN